MQKVIKHGKGKRKREPLYHFTCDECGREFNDAGVCKNIDEYPADDDCEE